MPRPPSGDWLGSPYLRFERHGRVAWVVIDRPEARNALTIAMYFGIRYAIERVDRATDLDALVITGTGHVFIPGGDLGHAATDWWTDLDLFKMDAMPFEALRGRSKPVVSAVNGICQGGGLMIALLSDVAVTSERATFRAPELLGAFCSDLGSGGLGISLGQGGFFFGLVAAGELFGQFDAQKYLTSLSGRSTTCLARTINSETSTSSPGVTEDLGQLRLCRRGWVLQRLPTRGNYVALKGSL